jgi:hypothetical protein
MVLHELPSGPYRAIARIEVRDRGLGQSAAQLRQKLIAAAARIGANAIILDPASTRRSVGAAPGGIGLYDDLVVSGLAVIQQSPRSAARADSSQAWLSRAFLAKRLWPAAELLVAAGLTAENDNPFAGSEEFATRISFQGRPSWPSI